MLRILQVVITFLFFFYSQAQPIIKCEGPIQDHFTKLLSENINQDKEKLDNQGKKIKKEDAANFLAITNYGMQKYIQSGKLLYGDPLTNFANQVLDRLKSVSEDDLSHIRVYTLRSTEVNAFAIHQGFICITTGLWARLETEDQLAFILGHEMNHITHQHSLDGFERSQEQISFGEMSRDELSQQYKYRQSLELESDHEGFILAKKAGYSDSLMAKTLKMLSLSHRPIEEMKVDYTLFEDDFFKLSSVYRLKETKEIVNFWDRNADNMVHPNAKDRYEAVLDLFSDDQTDKSSKPSNDLERLRKLAQKDLVETYIINGNYVDGLYHCMILLQDEPKDQFLLEAYAMLWYGLSAEKNIENGIRYSYDFRLTTGELQRFYYIFHNMNDQMMSVLATREIWKTYFKIPSSAFVNELKSKILVEFVEHQENDLSNFYTIDYLKKLKRERRKYSDGVEGALIIFLDKPEFLKSLNEARIANTIRKGNDEFFVEHQNVVSEDFDNKKILLTKPLYSKADLRARVSDVLVSNEEKSNKLLELSQNSDFSNTSIGFIGNITGDSFSTEDYNDMSSIYSYLQENIKHRGTDFLPFTSRYINELNSVSNVTGIGLISFQSLAYNKRLVGSAAVFSLLSVVGFPSYLRWQIEPQQYSRLLVAIFNLESHNVAFKYIKTSNTPLNEYLENAQIYHVFNQINNAK